MARLAMVKSLKIFIFSLVIEGTLNFMILPAYICSNISVLELSSDKQQALLCILSLNVTEVCTVF